jgi:hypothetical protein
VSSVSRTLLLLAVISAGAVAVWSTRERAAASASLSPLAPQATVSPSFCNVACAKTGIAIVDVLTPRGAPPFVRELPSFVTSAEVSRLSTPSKVAHYRIELTVSAELLGRRSEDVATVKIEDEFGVVGECSVRCQGTTTGLIENGARLFFGTVGAACRAYASARLHPDVDPADLRVRFIGELDAFNARSQWRVEPDWDGNPVLRIELAENLPAGHYEGQVRIAFSGTESSLRAWLHKL